MNNRRKSLLLPILIGAGVLRAVTIGVTFFYNRPLFYGEAAALAVLAVFLLINTRRIRNDTARYLSRIARHLSQEKQDSLSAFPMPVAVCGASGEIVWYNELFREQVLEGSEIFGEPAAVITGGCSLEDAQKKKALDVRLGKKRYTVSLSQVNMRDSKLYVLYYLDDTRLKETAEEYAASRPAVMVVYIDNLEEIMQDVRDSEKAQMSGKVETLLEDWIGSTTGILRKCGTDKYMVVIEQRHLQGILEGKFDILDRVRTIQTGERAGITLSIGVGRGETLRESEEMARQALEMALGRGGDQAAIKTKNGFDFYGGASKGVERRTKVRTRVVASALSELIQTAENVLVMGHRYSDLDCLGSAVAMAAAVRAMGKPANVVTQRKTTLAPELLERYGKAGRGDLFLEPDNAMLLVSRRTLLIITDTHNPNMLEWPPLYQAAQTVVVIDHHRKMVDFIDNAVIFYHEPYSSSASEMVAELVQYMAGSSLTRLEAEALLAGIMLDTRSFVMKAGVRTFEAAAYLRKQGADTVEVKRMFSGSMEAYRKKSAIVAGAELYRHTAIASDEEGGPEVRIAAAQAADELLSIKGVEASFALFVDGEDVNISARSMGDFNVQLVMEALGGGGHLTMAGALLKHTSMEEAKRRLMEAIDGHLEARERSLAAQLQQNDTI